MIKPKIASAPTYEEFFFCLSFKTRSKIINFRKNNNVISNKIYFNIEKQRQCQVKLQIFDQ